MGRLDGKVAIITGAGSGLGRQLALRFAKEGAKVGVLSITAANVDRTVKDIVDAGGQAHGVAIDIVAASAIKPAVDAVAEALGSIDILINCAHDQSTIFSSVLELSDEQLQRQFDVGPFAYLHFMQACYPYLERNGGRVINFASCIGLICRPNYTPYAMQKEAVRALSRTAAREWGAKAITVNCILPVAATEGYEATVAQGQAPIVPDLPITRPGSAYDDIAPIAVFLASDEASFMTGYCFYGDGGRMIDAAR